jgi:hypothetical protein
MAEICQQGIVRIFYKSAGFMSNRVVTANVLFPDLSKVTEIPLVEVGGGIYYMDKMFQAGTYLVEFYEDGEKKVVQVYDVRKKIRNLCSDGTLVGL